MIATIYCLVNNKSGIPFYVGSALNFKARAAFHLKESKTGKSKVYKYIQNNNIEFSVIELETSEFKNFGQKNKAEGVWYDKLVSEGAVLYNTYRPVGSENWKNVSDSAIIKTLSEGKRQKEASRFLGTTINYIVFRLNVLRQIYDCKNTAQLIAVFSKKGLIE